MPTTTGRPSATISPSRRRSSKLCSTVLPNPKPGSRQMRSSEMPASTANRSRSSRNAATSDTTSSYRGPTCIVRGSPSMCIRHRAPDSATTPASSGSPRKAVTSFTSSAPRASPAGHLRLRGVDRDGHVALQRLEHRNHALQLVVERDRRRTGPRRLASDVDDRRPFVEHPPSGSDSVVGRQVGAAVRERVRGDVDDPHHGRPRENAARSLVGSFPRGYDRNRAPATGRPLPERDRADRRNSGQGFSRKLRASVRAHHFAWNS